MKHSNNLFAIPARLPKEELQESLIPDSCVKIERIVSAGQATPPGVWLEQDMDEWVALLQGMAVIGYEGNRSVDLEPGDWILIPAHVKHRVISTSGAPPCVWLAVHGKLIDR
ncbi:MAG: hypothetical protein STSR0007_01870 [Thermovirga sp.]